jgi:hypothetical protein
LANDKPFSELLAWFYLIGWAAWDDTEERRFQRQVFRLTRGQHVTTSRQLARDWGWGHHRVSRFMKTLHSCSMIRLETGPTVAHGCTLVTICNYETYQSNGNGTAHTRPTDGPDAAQTRPSVDAPLTHEGRREEGQEGKKSTTRAGGVVASLESALPSRPDPLAPPRISQKARDFIANFKDDATKLHVTEFIGVMEADSAIPEHRIVAVVRELWNARQGLNIEAENLPQDKLFNYALEESMKRGVRQVSYVKSVLRNGIMKLREGIKPWNHHAKT